MTNPLPPPPPPRPGLPTWFLISIVGVGVLLVVVVGTVLAVSLGGNGEDSDSASDTETVVEMVEPDTFTVKGEMELYAAGSVLHYSGTCSGYEGYEDMAQGAQVVIRDSKGETVALGALEAGQSRGRNTCVFPFTVDGVPAGGTAYSVEVAHRGEISFTQDEAEETGVSLTLGD